MQLQGGREAADLHVMPLRADGWEPSCVTMRHLLPAGPRQPGYAAPHRARAGVAGGGAAAGLLRPLQRQGGLLRERGGGTERCELLMSVGRARTWEGREKKCGHWALAAQPGARAVQSAGAPALVRPAASSLPPSLPPLPPRAAGAQGLAGGGLPPAGGAAHAGGVGAPAGRARPGAPCCRARPLCGRHQRQRGTSRRSLGRRQQCSSSSSGGGGRV